MTERRPDDAYYTPEWATRALIPHLPKGWRRQRLLEPSCGDGAIIRALDRADDNTTAVDVRNDALEALPPEVRAIHRSFLDWRPPWEPSFPLVITNPPFNATLEFAEACLRWCAPRGHVFLLMRLSFFGSKKRQRFHFDNPIHALYPLTGKRLSFTGDGKTDNTEYAWFHWRKDARGELIPGSVHPLARPEDLG